MASTKILTLGLLALTSATLMIPAQAEIIEELNHNYKGAVLSYAPSTYRQTARSLYPGHMLGNVQQQIEASFTYNWPYRADTYELHFTNSEELARAIYSLAIYTGDISADIPRDKFYRGVSGFHYSAAQLWGFANEVDEKNIELTSEEQSFLDDLLANSVLKRQSDGTYVLGGQVHHALGAAPGKKRTFEQNLRHERLHVYWDADQQFRNKWQQQWEALSEDARAQARAKLKNYNQDNLPQLIEEWAIGEAEKQPLPHSAA